MKGMTDYAGGLEDICNGQELLDRWKASPFEVSGDYSERYSRIIDEVKFFALNYWTRDIIFSDEKKSQVAFYCIRVENEMVKNPKFNAFDGYFLRLGVMYHAVSSDSEMQKMMDLEYSDKVKAPSGVLDLPQILNFYSDFL